MTDTPDRFFGSFGKFVALLSFAFLLLCGILFVALLIDADRTSTHPAATIAPDSAKARAK